jgi:hypothetical protein
MGTTGTETAKRFRIGGEAGLNEAVATEIKWKRAVSLAADVLAGLRSRDLPRLPSGTDEEALRAMLRSPDSLAGLSRSLFDVGLRVQIVGPAQKLPEVFQSVDLTDSTYLSVDRRDPTAADIRGVRARLGRSAAAYLITDPAPEDQSLSRSAILHAGVNGSDILLRRVDEVGEYVDNYVSGSELFEKVVGQGVLTVVTGRNLEASQISCRKVG